MADVCIGCGAEAEAQPWVVVLSGSELASLNGSSNSEAWVSAPVCVKCHVDPAHRKRRLKGHFFQRHQAAVAVSKAGSSTLGA